LNNVRLVGQGVESVRKTAITSTDGAKTDFDCIVLATGFEVQDFLALMEIIGKSGVRLSKQWERSGGAQAYMGTYVHNFPNFGVM